MKLSPETVLRNQLRGLKRQNDKLKKALHCAICIIRNQAGTCEHHQPNKAETWWRWANELEVEGGLRKETPKEIELDKKK